MTDGHRRSLIKTVSYRLSSSILTGVLVFIFTKEWVISLGVGALDILIKSLWYYSHERLWNKTKWGKS